MKRAPKRGRGRVRPALSVAFAGASALALLACGNGDSSAAFAPPAGPGAGGNAAAGSTNASTGGAGQASSVQGGSVSAVGGSATPPAMGEACNGSGVHKQLPGSGQSYCIKAHPGCAVVGAGCPLYVTLNMGGAFFEYVDQPDKYGKVIVAALEHFCDCADLKDSQAELPRVVRKDYPGHDANRVYALGWSAGAGGIARGQCIGAKFQWDQSMFGKTSDTYAAVALIGGYPGCAPDFKPAAANYHVIAIAGMNDIFGGSNAGDTSAEQALRRLAVTNGCSTPQATWCSVPAGDGYVPRGDGTDIVQKISFGDCPNGDVVGYRFKDEAHTPAFRAHFDPKVSGFELAWQFVSGRTKDKSGKVGSGGQCP